MLGPRPSGTMGCPVQFEHLMLWAGCALSVSSEGRGRQNTCRHSQRGQEKRQHLGRQSPPCLLGRRYWRRKKPGRRSGRGPCRSAPTSSAGTSERPRRAGQQLGRQGGEHGVRLCEMKPGQGHAIQRRCSRQETGNSLLSARCLQCLLVGLSDQP